MKLKICFLEFLCLFICLRAAAKVDSAALKVGDRVPDFIISNLVNYKSSNARISDFKGKLLILDFWATYCTSCLKHFPTVDSLQQSFPNDIQILLVDTKSTRDKKENILATLARFKSNDGKPFNLPSVINDTAFDEMFPHFSVPHYVWIDQNGIVRSITSSEELTRENIIKFLKYNNAPDLPLDHLEQFSILLKGKLDGIGGGGMRQINDTTRGVIMHNRTLLDMYKRVLYNRISGFSDNRVLLEVKDPAKLSYMGDGSDKREWERQNLYSYELIVPASRLDSLYADVLTDLNRYSSYYAQFKKRRIFCWILEKTKTSNIQSQGGQTVDALDDKSNPRLLNSTLLNLCIYINKLSGNQVVLDETGVIEKIDLRFAAGTATLESVQRQLKSYGLKLHSGYQTLEMLVIKDK